jgi:hypothetical protein
VRQNIPGSRREQELEKYLIPRIAPLLSENSQGHTRRLGRDLTIGQAKQEGNARPIRSVAEQNAGSHQNELTFFPSP